MHDHTKVVVSPDEAALSRFFFFCFSSTDDLLSCPPIVTRLVKASRPSVFSWNGRPGCRRRLPRWRPSWSVRAIIIIKYRSDGTWHMTHEIYVIIRRRVCTTVIHHEGVSMLSSSALWTDFLGGWEEEKKKKVEGTLRHSEKLEDGELLFLFCFLEQVYKIFDSWKKSQALHAFKESFFQSFCFLVFKDSSSSL